MIIFWYVLTAVCAYLIGSFNYSIVVSKVFTGDDIRSKGSGNAGSTNMQRAYGWRAGLITLLVDFMKALVPTLAARLLFTMYLPEHATLAAAVAGFFCAVGHCFPLYFGFKGGKGVAVGAIMIFMTDPRCFVVALAVFVILVAITRYVSLGSTMAGVSFPISYVCLIGASGADGIATLCLATALAVMVLVLHRKNYSRIFKGTESKISFSKK